jgi:hypothetical protein
MIFAIRKISVIKKQEYLVEMRKMKNFNEEKFVAELLKQHWEQVYFLLKTQMICGRFGKKYS